ncbi:MAG: hypothetical protein AAGA70_15870 [Pseudomonadota bacterium]
MSDGSDLSAEAKLAIRDEVRATLTRIGALFGIGSIVAFIGIFWAIAQQASVSVSRAVSDAVDEEGPRIEEAISATDQLIGAVAQQAEDAQQDLDGLVEQMASASDQIDGRLADFDAQVAGFAEYLDRLAARTQQIDVFEAELQAASARAVELEGMVAEIESTEGVRIAEIVRSLGDSGDVGDLLERLGTLEQSFSALAHVSGCESPRIAAGTTEGQESTWQRYSTNEAVIRVDTSDVGFQTTPVYLPSLGGDGGHWMVEGTSSVYQASPTGFDVYIRWTDRSVDVLQMTTERNLTINWVAIGC